MIRRTKNVTLALSEDAHRRARIYAAQAGWSLSSLLEFMLDHAEDLAQAVRVLRGDPNWGMNFKPTRR